MLNAAVQKKENELIFDDLYAWLSRAIAINPTWDMLEIGFGTDGFVPFYAQRVGTYIAIDIDDFRALYPNLPHNARLEIYDGNTFPLQNESVDLVASHSVFEHVSDVPRMIAESARVLRPGGYFYLTINPMYYSSWGSHGLKPDGTKVDPWDHLNPESPDYMTTVPHHMKKTDRTGCYLNKLTAAELLAEISRWPWSIMRFERGYEHVMPPEFAFRSGMPIAELTGDDIRLLARKDW